MAKRAGGSRSTHRPGGQGPSRAKKSESAASDGLAPEATTSPDPGSMSDGSTSDPVEAQYSEVAIAEAAPAVGSRRSRRERRRTKSRPADLTARAAAEDVWVREDLRRIGVVSLILIVSLGLAWVLFVPMDVLGLY